MMQNIQTNYHLRLYDISVDFPVIVVYNFVDGYILGTNSSTVYNSFGNIHKDCYHNKGWHFCYVDFEKTQDLVQLIKSSSHECIAGGPIKDTLKKAGVSLVSLASFAGAVVLSKSINKNLITFAKLVDAILEHVFTDTEKQYRYFSKSGNKKIVITLVNDKIDIKQMPENALKLSKDDNSYLIYATYDEPDIDAEIIATFEHEEDFAAWILENFGDLKSMTRFLDENNISENYPILITKDYNIIEDQISVMLNTKNYVISYVKDMFKDYNYALLGKHSFLFLFSFVATVAKGIDNSLYENAMSYLKEYQSGKSKKYGKNKIMEVVDKFNLSMLRNETLYKKVYDLISANIDSVVTKIGKPVAGMNKKIESLYKVAVLLSNFVHKNMTPADYDDLISFINEYEPYVLMYSIDDIKARLEKEHSTIVGDKDSALLSIKALGLAEYLFGYMVFYLIASLHAHTLYDLRLDVKSRIKVYAKKGKDFGNFMEFMINDKMYGPALSLGIMLYLYDSFVNKNNSYEFINEDVVLSKIPSNLFADTDIEAIFKDLKGMFKNLNVSYLHVRDYHDNLMKMLPTYSLINNYYDYINDKFTLYNAVLYPHQEKAMSAIMNSYKRGNDGFILSHSTGSGKSITIAKFIKDVTEHRKLEGHETRVLLVSKGEVLEKLSRELIYYLPESFVYMPNTVQEIKDMIDRNELPDILGISFTLLNHALSDYETEVFQESSASGESSNIAEQGTTEEEEEDSFIEISEDLEETESSRDDEGVSKLNQAIRSKISKIGKKEQSPRVSSRSPINMNSLERLMNYYHIIIVDEAHYIKNAYPVSISVSGSTFLSKNYRTAYGDLPDILPMGYYYVGNSSKIGSIFLFTYLQYANNKYELKTITEANRKFFLISTGTVFSNYPHESFLLFFLTGVAFANASYSNHFADFIEFAKTIYGHYVPNQRKDLISIYDRVINYISENNLDIENEGVLEAFKEISQNIDGLGDIIKQLVSDYYIDIFSEKDAQSLGLLSKPERKIIKVSSSVLMNESDMQSWAVINENIQYISNYDIILRLAKDIMFQYMRKNKSAKKSEDGKGIIFTDNSNRFGHSYKKFIDKNSITYRLLTGTIKDFITYNNLESSLYDAIHRTMIGILKGQPVNLNIDVDDTPLEIYSPGESYLVVDDSNPKQVHKVRAKVLFDNVVSFIDIILKEINKVNYNHSMLNLSTVLPFIMFNTLKTMYDCDRGARTGNGKSFYVLEHVKYAKYFMLTISEFMYNIMKSIERDEYLDVGALVKKVTYNYLTNTLLNVSLNNFTVYLSDSARETINHLLNNIIQSLVNIKGVINTYVANIDDLNDQKLPDISDKITISQVEKIVENVYEIELNRRAFLFVLSLSFNKNIEDIVEDYWMSYLYNTYGEDFFTFGKYVNAYFGSQAITSEKDSYELIKNIRPDKKDIAKTYSNVFDYAKSIGLINDYVYDILNKSVEKVMGKMIKNFSSRNYSLDPTLQKIFKRISVTGTGKTKIKLSDNFIKDPNMKLVVANLKAMAEGLNFSGGSAMYMIDYGFGIGYLSQVEARINRLNNRQKIDIFYIISDLQIEMRKVKALFYKDAVSAALGMNTKEIYKTLAAGETVNVEDYIARDNLMRVFSASAVDPSVRYNVAYLSNASGDKIILYTKDYQNIEKAVHERVQQLIEKDDVKTPASDDTSSKTQQNVDDVDIDIDI